MAERILTGMRPTGSLHLGHYVGVIKNMVALQKDFDCFFFLADWHAYNALFDKVPEIKASCYEYVKGWVAAGVDPNKSPIYRQSDLVEVLKLNQVFQCLTPPGWADRSPSWKDFKQNENADKKLDNLGFYNYPILQAADIAIVKGELVPVGEDQVSHIEIAREIVRKFNRLYKGKLPEPNPKLSEVPKLPGLDGSKKMSSSLGNTISLKETEKSLQKKVNKIKTDDQRGGVENPGNPANCTVYDYHKIFSKPQCREIQEGCTSASLSCGNCKKILGDNLKEELMPIAERYNKISDSYCDEILEEGLVKATKTAKHTWEEIRGVTGF